MRPASEATSIKTTTVLMTVETHNKVREYAERRGLQIKGATEQLLRIGLQVMENYEKELEEKISQATFQYPTKIK